MRQAFELPTATLDGFLSSADIGVWRDLDVIKRTQRTMPILNQNCAL